MARFVDVMDLPLAPEAAFDLLADFARTRDWDPGVVDAERLDRGPIGKGSRFRVEVAFLGRRIALDYRIQVYDPPWRLVLRARNDTVESLDELHFTPRGTGTRVSYEARLTLSGLAGLADPLLQLAFEPVGRAASRGLVAYANQIARSEAAEAARARTTLRTADAS